MNFDPFQPYANHCLVACPERFTDQLRPGEKRIILATQDDRFSELVDALKHGENFHIEEDENAYRTPVSTGQVLAIPRALTNQMMLCDGTGTMDVPRTVPVLGANNKPIWRKGSDGHPEMVTRQVGWMSVPRPKTCADIQNPVQVGDTLHFEHCYLTDDTEVMAGVYLLPYTALICKIVPTYSALYPAPELFPIAGYVLLSRVWESDVVDEPSAEGGLVKCRKVGDLVVETGVAPLPNEGQVAWISTPLRGTPDDLRVGMRVVIDQRQALVETIAGESYLAIRQEYVLAQRVPVFIEGHDEQSGLNFRIQNSEPSARLKNFVSDGV